MQDFNFSPGSNSRVYGYHALNCKGGANTIQISLSSGAIIIDAIGEWSGVALTNAVDVKGVITGATSTQATTNSITTTGSNDLIIAQFTQATVAASSVTLGGGFTLRANAPTGQSFGCVLGDQVGGAASYQGTASWSAQNTLWSAVLISFFHG